MEQNTEDSFLADATSSIPVIDGYTGPQHEIDFSLVNIPAGSAALVVVKGPQLGDFFVLKAGENTLGRNDDVDMLLDDVTVSRKHAVIKKVDNQWQLTDLGSLNGTYVDRNRVDEIFLLGGEELQIGKYRFAFLLPDKGDE